MSNNLNRYEKIETRRKIKHISQVGNSNITTNISNIRINNPLNPPISQGTNDNLSFSDIQINKHYVNYLKHSTKNDISFRNDQKPSKPGQKIIIKITNNAQNQKPSSQSDSYRTITHSNSPQKNERVNISNIRKAFLNLNRRSNYNITPIKRRVKSPQVSNIKDKIFKYTPSHLKKDFHSNNSSCNKKNERILISTLPRAIIDISNSDTVSHGLNITYNNDEIINFYLKLKSKNTKINSKMLSELKLLREEIDTFIKKYNSQEQ